MQIALFNSPAGDFLTGVSGGLRGEVVGISVQDYGSAQDFLHAEAICQKDRKGIAAAAEKREQIAGMARMGAAAGIVMAQRILEGVLPVACAGRAAVDMQGKNPLPAGEIPGRKPGKLGGYQHADPGLVERNPALDGGIGAAAPHKGRGGGTLPENLKKCPGVFAGMELDSHLITPFLPSYGCARRNVSRGKGTGQVLSGFDL